MIEGTIFSNDTIMRVDKQDTICLFFSVFRALKGWSSAMPRYIRLFEDHVRIIWEKDTREGWSLLLGFFTFSFILLGFFSLL